MLFRSQLRYHAIFVLELVAVKVLLISLCEKSFYRYSIYLDIFLYIVVYYRLIICLLYYLIYLYIARISYYRRVIYKFKYFKLQEFRIWDYYFLLIIQLIITDFIFSKYNIFILLFPCLNCFYYLYYLGVVFIFILY